ncbi:hypothetical protein GCL60_16500 [Silvanigrella paludirubra]|uniref:Uncharacterized protein n=1 Tax=Silvanigrella paludirubra TaxID=2499159 RepID=A0A6N6VSQ9_9BACT|nr:hypothetical protein [Silvanigrella paludirubra]KAB8035829.1 hypothetical protein GCL60_16500 [Silvanigrella paludirubra]
MRFTRQKPRAKWFELVLLSENDKDYTIKELSILMNTSTSNLFMFFKLWKIKSTSSKKIGRTIFSLYNSNYLKEKYSEIKKNGKDFNIHSKKILKMKLKLFEKYS